MTSQAGKTGVVGGPGGYASLWKPGARSQILEIDYLSRYADNLGKELPRIPAVKTFSDFRAFSRAGRNLAHWHLNYHTVACHPGVAVEEVLAPAASHAATVADRRYRVTKMKFAKTKDASGKNVNDKTTVIYNE